MGKGKSESRRRYREAAAAAQRRRELIAARLTRRDLIRLGVIAPTGRLSPTRGLSARAENSAGDITGQAPSPPTRPFIDPLPVVAGPDAAPGRIARSVGIDDFSRGGPPELFPQAGEGRRLPHQAFTHPVCAPQRYYETRQQEADVRVSSDLPLQRLWTFDGFSPGPTYICRYGTPILVRNINDLPLKNGGFGLNSVSTHLHNGHTPAESDGFPCDYFERGEFYDLHYPNAHASFSTPETIPAAFRDPVTGGDTRESLSTLWYHDQRVDFTAQNVYKGLAGFFLLFNQFDTGEETTGFRLPSGRFDVPIMVNDRVIDPDTGLLFFDLFNLDGILGDKFLVNGVIQPHFKVHPRRYRFRVLAGGPSRCFQFHLLDPAAAGAALPFWQIASDGNLLPAPLRVTSFRVSVAERVDIIIDFSNFAGKTLYLENRLSQRDGRGPDKNVVAGGLGERILQFDVVLPEVPDESADPGEPGTSYYAVPVPRPGEAAPVRRVFRFERGDGAWQVNGNFMSCDTPPRFRVKRGTAERWVIQNISGEWQHPVHVHLEEFQMLRRNREAPPLAERGRKDVACLEFNEEVELFMRFRDFRGRYLIQCHNRLHEDHSMMPFEIDDVGDSNQRP